MSVHVKSDELVYRPDAVRKDDPQFFRDLVLWTVEKDGRAGERLARHGHQMEQRDITSAAFGGFIVPQFAVELAAGPVRAGDPFLSALEQLELPPEGMQITVPRSVTTAGATAHAQTSDNTDVSDTDMSLVDLQRPVCTIAGQADVSRQLIDRGGSVAENYLTRDITEAVNDALDDQLLNGTGSNGQLVGLRNVTAAVTVTWTDTNPTRPEFATFIARAAHDMSLVRERSPDTIIMHPRRWWWLAGSQGGIAGGVLFPFNYDVDPPAVATFAGCDIILDGNMTTTLGVSSNQDDVLVIRRRDMPVHVSPVMARVNQSTSASNWGVNIVAYRYAAWFPDRYRGTNVAILTGTGLTAPGSFTN